MATDEQHEPLGENPAALLVLNFEKHTLASVLKHLNGHEVARLMQSYEKVLGAGMPPQEKLAEVGTKFLEKGSAPPKGNFREALVLAFGADGAEQILRQDHWRTLADRITPAALAGLLKDERAEAIAIVLSQLAPAFSAEVLNALPDELRADSIDRLTFQQAVPDTTLDAILRAIEENVGVETGSGFSAAGAKQAAAILNQLDVEVAAKIIEKIKGQEPARAAAIEEGLFHFSDFLKLENRALQQVLAEVKPERLAIALKNLSEAERTPIYDALADQVKQVVRQEIEDSGKVPAREIKAAMREVTDVALRMDREGKIRIHPEPEEAS
ncbi:MAG TPA: FliG C-terminal domain-containing protein [Candidatus Binataceae bacterium]|nr:FliG C-terminal domain-containing protein [Candidatus Binataceae bacterium]